ncbi:MAG: D-alanine--D-alanine ligase family protein [Microbacteriaceae bacterium]|nr:D-alanine--D-alanine ligase family protein [Microbacteriaceae bacterium]
MSEAEFAAPESTGKITVAVLFGGRSSEHSISCVTAAGFCKNIDRERYDVVPIGITKDGEMVPVAPETIAAYSLESRPLPEVKANSERFLWPFSASDTTLRRLDANGAVHEVAKLDIVVIMMHGPCGEDGTVQGLCELVSLPYVGCGVLASALCMDKHALKVTLAAAGVAVAPWKRLTLAEYRANPGLVVGLDEGLEYPLFVKPLRAGSSVGVTRVTEQARLKAALEVAFAEDHIVLVESGITGREVEIAAISGRAGEPVRLSDVIGEIVFTGRDFYDFESKYLGEPGADVVIPAKVTEQEYAAVREAAALAYSAAGCEGYARLDFFLQANGVPVLNEINTLPGFTQYSMFPKLCEQSGLGYRELITELIELGLAVKR